MVLDVDDDLAQPKKPAAFPNRARAQGPKRLFGDKMVDYIRNWEGEDPDRRQFDKSGAYIVVSTHPTPAAASPSALPVPTPAPVKTSPHVTGLPLGTLRKGSRPPLKPSADLKPVVSPVAAATTVISFPQPSLLKIDKIEAPVVEAAPVVSSRGVSIGANHNRKLTSSHGRRVHIASDPPATSPSPGPASTPLASTKIRTFASPGVAAWENGSDTLDASVAFRDYRDSSPTRPAAARPALVINAADGTGQAVVITERGLEVRPVGAKPSTPSALDARPSGPSRSPKALAPISTMSFSSLAAIGSNGGTFVSLKPATSSKASPHYHSKRSATAATGYQSVHSPQASLYSGPHTVNPSKLMSPVASLSSMHRLSRMQSDSIGSWGGDDFVDSGLDDGSAML